MSTDPDDDLAPRGRLVMDTACSACDGPLPPDGAYSVSFRLPVSSPKRWRVCNLTCSLQCLARIVAQMQAAAARRAERQAGRYADAASIMTAPPRGR